MAKRVVEEEEEEDFPVKYLIGFLFHLLKATKRLPLAGCSRDDLIVTGVITAAITFPARPLPAATRALSFFSRFFRSFFSLLLIHFPGFSAG
jgi:hypothetical protein